tara:strand:- start:780 stop:2021 length:1242 start_codon:yes stop_codon:yes gene_type:complete
METVSTTTIETPAVSTTTTSTKRKNMDTEDDQQQKKKQLKQKKHNYKKFIERRGIERDFSAIDDWESDSHYSWYVSGDRDKTTEPAVDVKKQMTTRETTSSITATNSVNKKAKYKRTVINSDGSSLIEEQSFEHHTKQIMTCVKKLKESKTMWLEHHRSNEKKLEDKIFKKQEEIYSYRTNIPVGVPKDIQYGSFSKPNPEYVVRNKISYLTGMMNELYKGLKESELIVLEKQLHRCIHTKNPHVADLSKIPSQYLDHSMWIDYLLTNPNKLKHHLDEGQNILTVFGTAEQEESTVVQLPQGWADNLAEDHYYTIQGGHVVQPFPLYKEDKILSRSDQKTLRDNIVVYQEEIDRSKQDLLQLRRKQRDDEFEEQQKKSGKSLLTIAQKFNITKQAVESNKFNLGGKKDLPLHE